MLRVLRPITQIIIPSSCESTRWMVSIVSGKAADAALTSTIVKRSWLPSSLTGRLHRTSC